MERLARRDEKMDSGCLLFGRMQLLRTKALCVSEGMGLSSYESIVTLHPVLNSAASCFFSED